MKHKGQEDRDKAQGLHTHTLRLLRSIGYYLANPNEMEWQAIRSDMDNLNVFFKALDEQ